MRATLLAVLASVWLAGCATGLAFYASADDWADYRRFRVAGDLDARLAAASEYLAARPDGVFAPELRAFVARAEPVFYAHEQGTRQGVERYLAALPHGAHAPEALEKLMSERERARNAEVGPGVVAETERRIVLEQTRRAAARELAVAWIEGLLDPSVWREPFARAPLAILVPWSIALPEAQCRNDWSGTGLRHCRKLFERRFGVVRAGELVPRVLGLIVELGFDEGGVVRGARVHGPGMWTRLVEALDGRALVGPEARARAELAGAERFAELWQAHGCAGASSPFASEVSCGALRVRAVARVEGEDELTLSFEPDDDEPAARTPVPERPEPAYPDD